MSDLLDIDEQPLRSALYAGEELAKPAQRPVRTRNGYSIRPAENRSGRGWELRDPEGCLVASYDSYQDARTALQWSDER